VHEEEATGAVTKMVASEEPAVTMRARIGEIMARGGRGRLGWRGAEGNECRIKGM
jgi:hypothetical protein